MIYTGFQWRGRTTVGGDDATTLREVMLVDRDWRTVTGRWFAGGYDELGMDVRLTRIGREPIVLGVDPTSLNRSGAQRVRVFGANLPTTPTPRELDLGPGVTLARIVSATPQSIVAEVNVASDAAPVPGTLRSWFHCAQPSRCSIASTTQGLARLEHGARRRRGVPQDVRAVRGNRVFQRRRWQTGYEGRPGARRR
jgi:hypothetical protein